MISAFVTWWKRYFSDPGSAYLLLFILGGLFILTTFSSILGPIIASIVIAYVLESGVQGLVRCKCGRKLSVIIVFIIFMALFIVGVIGLLPLLSRQLTNVIAELPNVADTLKIFANKSPGYFPFIPQSQIDQLIINLNAKISELAKMILSASWMILPNLFSITLYLVMVPLLVYFFLMDKEKILLWLSNRFLPEKNNRVLGLVWQDVRQQIANYLRGRVIEALIVFVVTLIAFLILGLQYALLLSAIVGLSVFIPYIGVIIVTVPVVAVGTLQWGFSDHLLWLLIVYAVIITLDGNVLMPLLFSEVVSLHPVAIILAILVFGGIWGFWGMFFAIPLAALVKAVMVHWPVTRV